MLTLGQKIRMLEKLAATDAFADTRAANPVDTPINTNGRNLPTAPKWYANLAMPFSSEASNLFWRGPGSRPPAATAPVAPAAPAATPKWNDNLAMPFSSEASNLFWRGPGSRPAPSTSPPAPAPATVPATAPAPAARVPATVVAAPAAPAARPAASAISKATSEGPPHVFADVRAIANGDKEYALEGMRAARSQLSGRGSAAQMRDAYNAFNTYRGMAAEAGATNLRNAPVASEQAAVRAMRERAAARAAAKATTAPAAPAPVAVATAPVAAAPVAAPVSQVPVPPVQPTASLFGSNRDANPTPAQMAVGSHDVSRSNFSGPSWAAIDRVRRAQTAQAAAIAPPATTSR